MSSSTTFRSYVAATSEDTRDYNCFAWAAGDVSQRWDPTTPDGHWPDGVPRELTIPAVVAAYQTCGYSICADCDFEHGYEKIAVYVMQNIPKHAARQIDSGAWTSKLGDIWDIEHRTLSGIEGTGPRDYGNATIFMKRPIILAQGIMK